MIIIRMILFFLIIIALWIPFDLLIGRKRYLKRVDQHIYPKRHSDFELYSFGETLYKQLFEDIRNARHSVHILFYIIRADDISQKFVQILCEKAKEGVEVRLLLDKIGGVKFKKELILKLRQNGVSFSFTHKPRLPFFFFTLNHRNHRKVTVIDGKLGYLGGFNIGEEYMGYDPKLGPWRDYHLRIDGEGALDLQKQFLIDWYFSTKEDLRGRTKYYPTGKKGSSTHQFVTTNGAYLRSSFMWLLNQAEHEVYIGTPYFIPGKKLFTKLVELLQKGVKIYVIVPQHEDHPLVIAAALPYLLQLKRLGAHVYLFRNGFYHGKTIIIDEKIVDIGTANFDLRSLYSNDEMNCMIYDEKFIKIFKKHIRLDMKEANILDEHFLTHLTWKDRIKSKIAGVFIRFF